MEQGQCPWGKRVRGRLANIAPIDDNFLTTDVALSGLGLLRGERMGSQIVH